MEPQVEDKPQHFGVSIRPEGKEGRNRDYRCKHDSVGFHAEDQTDNNPHQKSHKHDRQIADRSMRQEVSRLAHEVVPAFRTASRCVEVSTEDLPSSADRASKLEEGSEVQPLQCTGYTSPHAG